MNWVARLPEKTRPVVLTSAYGLIGAGAAVAFLVLTNLLYRSTFVPLARCSLPVFLVGSLAVVVGSSLIVGLLLFRFAPEAAGSGIPQLKIAYWKDLGWIPWHSTWVKFVAGVLSIGGGSSLGREGPTVFMASGCASAVAGQLGLAKQGRRAACASGAAAGLAASFNTPLAAITFVLEELFGELNSRVLGSVVLASVIGAFVTHACLGRQPAFMVPDTEPPSWQFYILVPAVAAAAAAIGALFQRRVLTLRTRIRERSRIPPRLRPCVGGLITWAVGVSVFCATGRLGVFSLGYDDLSAALHLEVPWQTAGLMVAAKLFVTIMCYVWGGCGGIFSPMLFLGGMTGLCIGGLAGLGMPLTGADHVILAAVGMSACLGAVVHAPLTALLIVFEMTHQFAMVPALMLGAVVSQAVAHLFSKNNFYDALLYQDGHEIVHVKPPRDLEGWQDLPISAIANFKPVVLREFTPAALRDTLRYPFQRYPVETGATARGVVSRVEIETALKEGRIPCCTSVAECSTDRTVREIGARIIESPLGIVLLTDPSTGQLTGLVTLHDLLRAQVAAAE